MKRSHYLLLATTLLTQTMPVWSMERDDFFLNEEQNLNKTSQKKKNSKQFQLLENSIRLNQSERSGKLRIITTKGHEDVSCIIKHIKFEAPELDVRLKDNLEKVLKSTPKAPLPQVIGTVQERIQCLFKYKGKEKTHEFLHSKKHIAKGEWKYKEDNEYARNLFTLVHFTASVENQLHHIILDHPHQIEMPHIRRGQIEKEERGRNYFDGETVCLERRVLSNWKNPRTDETYNHNAILRDLDIESHQGNSIVYVEPFNLEKNVIKSNKYDYIGAYNFITDLEAEKKLKNKDLGNLIYSDGEHIYLPHVTQEIWEIKNENRAGFFIASYNKEKKLNFISGVKTFGGQKLDRGLYQILSVEEKNNERIEKWKRLGEDYKDDEPVKITTSAGMASIPGMGFLAKRVIPTSRLDDQEEPINSNIISQVINLRSQIEQIEDRMKSVGKHHNSQGTILMVGPSGGGKSTFCHLFAGRHLKGKEKKIKKEQESEEFNEEEIENQGYYKKDIRLTTDDPIPGFEIGHEYGSKTKLPAAYFVDDENRKCLLVDSPGFEDTGGGIADICNGFSIRKIFNNSQKIKVVCVINQQAIETRSNGLATTLENLTKLFPIEKELHNCVSFVLTKKNKKGSVVSILKEMKQDIEKDEKKLGFNEPSLRLLDFLIKNEKRLASIPEAQNKGSFNFNMKFVYNAIENSDYISNPKVNISLSGKAEKLIFDSSTDLNEYLKNYIKREGNNRLINYCRKKISTTQDFKEVNKVTYVQALRNRFKQDAEKLEEIQKIKGQDRAAVADIFLNDLGAYIPIDDIRNIKKQIDFLKTIGGKVTYEIEKWQESLGTTIEKIKALGKTPKGVVENGILYLQVPFLGTSEIQSEINKTPNCPIQVSAWNTIFGDGNVISHGQNLSMIAPQIKILEKTNIDLSGLPGKPGTNGVGAGAHGLPGSPGGNGGHFYLRLFETENNLKDLLNVNTDGGIGGSGGNGADGADGDDGDLNVATRSLTEKRYGGVLNHETYEGTRSYYEQKGSDGKPGGNGGQGGQGGSSGTSRIIGYDWYSNPQNGRVGHNGKAGQEGLQGRDCEGDYCPGHYIIKSTIKGTESFFHPEGIPSQQPLGLFFNYFAGSITVPKHQEPRSRGQNDNNNVKLNNEGQEKPESQVPLNEELLLEDFSNQYFKNAKNLKIAPFMKVFPGLLETKLSETEDKEPSGSNFNNNTKFEPQFKNNENVRFTSKEEYFNFGSNKPSGGSENFYDHKNTKTSFSFKNDQDDKGSSSQHFQREQEQNEFLEKISERYIKALRKSDPMRDEIMWGGDIELNEIAEIKNLHIKIYGQGREQNPLLVGSINRMVVIHLWFDQGHYQNYNPITGKKTNVPGDGNCLFHAVLRAINDNSSIEEIRLLRNQVANRLQSLVDRINLKQRVAHGGTKENNWRTIFVTPTHENDNPIYVRFAAIFKAENKIQLTEAFNALPPGFLRDEAVQINEYLVRNSFSNQNIEEDEEFQNFNPNSDEEDNKNIN